MGSKYQSRCSHCKGRFAPAILKPKFDICIALNQEARTAKLFWLLVPFSILDSLTKYPTTNYWGYSDKLSIHIDCLTIPLVLYGKSLKKFRKVHIGAKIRISAEVLLLFVDGPIHLRKDDLGENYD